MIETIHKYSVASPILKEIVSSFVFWRREGADNKSRIFLPNATPGMGMTLSGGLYVKNEDVYEIMPVFGTRNIINKPSEIRTEGDFFNISIRFFFPNGLHLFSKVPMSEIYASSSFSLDHVFLKYDIEHLMEKLYKKSTDLEKVQVLESFLESKIVYNYPLVLRGIILFVNASNGYCKVSDVAKQFSLTERTINRYFNNYIGVSLIAYINLIRFRSVLNSNSNLNKVTIKNLMDCGYYDQSHFIKQFKSYSKVSPTQFVKLKQSGTLSDFYNV